MGEHLFYLNPTSTQKLKFSVTAFETTTYVSCPYLTFIKDHLSRDICLSHHCTWEHQTWFFSPIISIGEIPMSKMASYSSSKAALTMFSAIMRQELFKWEVKVSIVQPGGFRTSRCLSLRALQCSSRQGCWKCFVLLKMNALRSTKGGWHGWAWPLLRLER